MKILICGLGSIGQRHVRLIQKILGDQAEIAAYRVRKLNIAISDTLEARLDVAPENVLKLKVFDNFEAALAWEPQVVFITNPISMHMEIALASVQANAHIFIEKPLSHTMEGVDELISLVQERKLTAMVGYQQRYHPAYAKIKSLLNDQCIGNVISADLHFGEWLPGMHSYEDYRTSHASRKEQGGGVVLCLSHEIDLAYWLFGTPDAVYAIGDHYSELELDVEDAVTIMLSCKNRAKKIFPVTVHLDFLQKPIRRYIHIVGSEGSIMFDHGEGILKILKPSPCECEEITFDHFQRNDMFEDELRDFFTSIKAGSKSPISIEDGMKTLEICLNIKESMAMGSVRKQL